jgi:hypothetical protein
MDKEDWIRQRAYNIWCAEGWPKGRDKEHWEQARTEAEKLFQSSSAQTKTPNMQEQSAAES